MNKKRIEEVNYLLTSALLFYSAFFYLAMIKSDAQLFIATLIHSMLFFVVMYLSKVFHDLGAEIKNFKIKAIFYLIYYFVLIYLLTPLIIIAIYIGYLLSKDDFLDLLARKLRKICKKQSKENKNEKNKNKK